MKKIDREKIIFEIIKDKKQLKISELLLFLKDYNIEFNQRTILRDLKRLIEQNLISQAGGSKNTYYFISQANKILQKLYYVQNKNQKD